MAQYTISYSEDCVGKLSTEGTEMLTRMALGRGHRSSRILWEIIAFTWLIATLSDVKLTLKVRGVSTDHCNCTKTEVWSNFLRLLCQQAAEGLL